VPDPPGTTRFGADGPDVRAVVLAAGAARRFGSDKLLAELDGRPLLQHVLDRLAEAGLDDPVVVVPPDHDRLRAAIAWRRAELAVNPAPFEGLSSSLRVGWAAAIRASTPPDAVLVVLGDQPRLQPAVVRALIAAPLDLARPIVAPRYAIGGGRNPVRIERPAEALVLSTTGDRGLGPLVEARPDLVRALEAPGTNPDVDVPADLDRLSQAS
jgi:molybdenum cofactor cytidylyltransferase